MRWPELSGSWARSSTHWSESLQACWEWLCYCLAGVESKPSPVSNSYSRTLYITCLFMTISICLSMCIYVCLFIYLLCLSMQIPVFQLSWAFLFAFHLSICVFLSVSHLSVYMYSCLSAIYLSMYSCLSFIYLSMSICLPYVCLYFWLPVFDLHVYHLMMFIVSFLPEYFCLTSFGFALIWVIYLHNDVYVCVCVHVCIIYMDF